MSTDDPLRLCIAVDRGASPITGQVTAAGAPERAFAGWTELFAALEAAIATDHYEGEPSAEAL